MAAATYQQRAVFGETPAWVGRVTTAAIVAAVGVIQEPVETTDHAQRMRLATWLLRESPFVAARFAAILASIVQVEDTNGTVDSPITDAALLTLIETNWGRFADALTPGA